jgi:hypothetical protein
VEEAVTVIEDPTALETSTEATESVEVAMGAPTEGDSEEVAEEADKGDTK